MLRPPPRRLSTSTGSGRGSTSSTSTSSGGTPDGGAACAPDDGLEVGSVAKVGPYVLGGRLGKGAFAVVRLGKHLITGESVAVKLFDKRRITDDYVIATLHREGHLLSKLHHPNIVKLLEVIETTDLLVLVTEMASMDLLSYLCDVSVMTEDMARQRFRELVSAVAHVHQQNIVHRDLKAENLMLDNKNQLTLIDFGLSNDLTGKEFLETACGSMAYSAPELLGKKPYGKEVDIWSMGVCLFVMLTGKLPFKTDGNLTELHAMMLDGQYDLPSDMSPSLQRLLISMFQVKPARRATLEQLCEDEWVMGDDGPQTHLLGIVSPMSQIKSTILQQMANIGFEEDEVKSALQNNKRNRAYATYQLLLAAERNKKRQHNLQARLSSGSSSPPPLLRSSSAREDTPRTRRSSEPLSPMRPSLSPRPSRSPSRPGSGRMRLNSDGAALKLPGGLRRGTSASVLPRSPSASMSRNKSHTSLGTTKLEEQAKQREASRHRSAMSSPVELLITLDPAPAASLFDKRIAKMIALCEETETLSPGEQDCLEHLVHEALRVAPSRALFDFVTERGWNGVDFGLLDFDCLPAMGRELRELFPVAIADLLRSESSSPRPSLSPSPSFLDEKSSGRRSSDASVLGSSRRGSTSSSRPGTRQGQDRQRIRRSISTPLQTATTKTSLRMSPARTSRD